MSNFFPNAAQSPGIFNNTGSGSGLFSGFSNNRFIGGSKEFLTSNTLVAKVVFLLLVVILFVIALRVGSGLIGWLFQPTNSPKIVDGKRDGGTFGVIPQNPNLSGSIPILRSRDQRGGLEFTWTIWLYLQDNWQQSNGNYKHIFSKGSQGKNGPADWKGIAYPNNAPGLYIHPNQNSLVILMNTVNSLGKGNNEEILINDVPLNKWINVGLRVKGKTMDVYVNGQVVSRHVFKAVPRQNYGDVFINQNGGFNGQMSDLWYHDYALTGTQIMDIVNAGPNMNSDSSDSPSKYGPPYFSLAWYFDNSNYAPK